MPVSTSCHALTPQSASGETSARLAEPQSDSVQPAVVGLGAFSRIATISVDDGPNELVVDAAEGIADQDARVASLMRENGCASVVLANKWDLVDKDDREDRLADIDHGLRFMNDVPVVSVSALTGQGFRRLFDRLDRVAKAGEQRIPTADLNRWLQDVSEKHPPSMASKGALRRPNKLFYASQVGVRPPTVVVFCTDPKAIQTSYVRFLENQLRESFGFEGTPVRVRLRKRSGRKGEERRP